MLVLRRGFDRESRQLPSRVEPDRHPRRWDKMAQAAARRSLGAYGEQDLLAGGGLGADEIVGLDGSGDADALGAIFCSGVLAHNPAMGVDENVRATSEFARQGQLEIDFRAWGKFLVDHKIDPAAGDVASRAAEKSGLLGGGANFDWKR